MFTLLRYFFVTLGVIFFVIILLAAYVWFANLWNVQAIFSAVTYTPTTTVDEGSSDDGTLSTEQEDAMKKFGIDSDFFSNLSEEQIDCLYDTLGAERVEEIKAGAMPSPVEIARASGCM